MSELWTAQQREWLEAMGHTVWSVASAETRVAERQPDAIAEPGRAGGAMREAAALLARDARPARPAGPATVRAAAPDRLMQALLRASGGADEAVVVGLVGDIAALRGNGAGKRALWPRLRALRRTPRA